MDDKYTSGHGHLRRGPAGKVDLLDTRKRQRSAGVLRQRPDLAHFADRHVRPCWVRTIHSAHGAAAERVVAHLESFRANTVDARSAYVAISRARSSAASYTDSRADLTSALGLRDGAQVGALDETWQQEKDATMELE